MRNIKTRKNLLNPGHLDSIPKTASVLAKSERLECLQKQVRTNMTATP